MRMNPPPAPISGPTQPTAAPSVEPGVNEGVYDLSTFDFHDPHPSSFHPLGTSVFAAVRRDEIACVTDSSSTSFFIDDGVAATGELPTTTPFPAGTTSDMDPMDATT